MPQEKLTFEQFLQEVDAKDQDFAKSLHDYLVENGCKPTFEEKKTSNLGSYKHGKTKKVVINMLQKKQGLHVRIYGENIGGYGDFLNEMPDELVKAVEKSGICKRLVNNTCSPKCTGYDFMVRDKHFQQCRYNCFEFLVTDESSDYIRAFVENEMTQRLAA